MEFYEVYFPGDTIGFGAIKMVVPEVAHAAECEADGPLFG